METTTQKIQYGHDLYFGMYTDEANILIACKMFHLRDRTDARQVVRTELVEEIRKAQAWVESYGHTEVHDTEVRAAIAVWVSRKICAPQGWYGLDNYFEPYAG